MEKTPEAKIIGSCGVGLVVLMVVVRRKRR
jgi:hypothetical protein